MFASQGLGGRVGGGGTSGSVTAFLWSVVWALVALPALGGVAAPRREAPEVLALRYATNPQYTRIVLDVSEPVSFEVRRVRDPDRLALNIRGARTRVAGPMPIADELVEQVRVNNGARRVQFVVDLHQRLEFNSFSLPADGQRADRIVIDVLRPEAESVIEAAASSPAAPLVVVIDPGHGGGDPGAVREGVKEKDVVLAIGREVARRLNNQPGIRAVLTRSGDSSLELPERVALAKRVDGDLFLSIHCNTHAEPEVSGMEVYFLSLRGATDREAYELADVENAERIVGLDSGTSRNALVMDILMDLKMTQILKDSARLSSHILDAAAASGIVGTRQVKQAGFSVLKSLAMPSALVEVAYLSNPNDLAVLQSAQGRREIAGTVVEGILAWRRTDRAGQFPTARDEQAWAGDYRVRRGDCLWGLAREHGTTVTEITRHNNLPSGDINVGQILRLPIPARSP